MRLAALVVVALLAASGCLNTTLGGVEAHDFVQGKNYKKWVIEVDYATGHKPSSDLLEFLKGRLTPVVDKPQGVEFRLDEILTGTSKEWGTNELATFSDDHQDVRTEGGTVVLHLLFVEGHSSADNGDKKVLGVAIGHDTIAIFVDSMASLCAGTIIPGTCNQAPYYRSVLLHEFGHALGLVNNGISMVRDHEASQCNDRKDKGHSSNSDSVMNCNVEVGIQLLGLGSNPPSSFDSDDLADLQAARNG